MDRIVLKGKISEIIKILEELRKRYCNERNGI